jgi:quercetin dioxygenase-like cupin family protein
MMTEAIQHFSIKAAEGESYFVIGDVITFKVTGKETNNSYLIVEVVCQPDGGPWFLHTHEPQETFHVVEGVFEVYGQQGDGEKYAIRAEVGDTVHVPSNIPHGFKNVGKTVGKMTLTYNPAEPMLHFFHEIGLPMQDRNTLPDLSQMPDNDQILGILRNYMTLVEVPV